MQCTNHAPWRWLSGISSGVSDSGKAVFEVKPGLMQVADQVRALHDAGLWHGRLNAETILLKGLARVQLLGECSSGSTADAALQQNSHGQPTHPSSSGQCSLLELTAMWCSRQASMLLV